MEHCTLVPELVSVRQRVALGRVLWGAGQKGCGCLTFLVL